MNHRDDMPIRADGDGVSIDLPRELRRTLAGVAVQMRQLLREEDPSSDTALVRVFPPAYDDPLRNLDYERLAHDGLLTGKLAALDTLERTAEEDRLSIDEANAWLTALNDARLVIGSRLEVTEETTEADFAEGSAERSAFGVYAFCAWVQEQLVEALSV